MPQDEEYSKALRADVVSATEQIKARHEQAYDGVLGELPEWVPPYHCRTFSHYRNQLLDAGFPSREILSWIDAEDDLTAPDCGWGTYVPPDYSDAVHHLALIRKAVMLGKKDGLRFLGGDDAVRGRRIVDSAKEGHVATHGSSQAKNMRWQSMQQTIDKLRRMHPTWSWAEIKRRAAIEHRCSSRTVERHCQDPRKS